jgi:transposase
MWGEYRHAAGTRSNDSRNNGRTGRCWRCGYTHPAGADGDRHT